MTKTSPSTETINPQEEKLHALQSLFPEAFREGKLDTDLLSATLGDRISNEKEAYGMTWAGKTDARKQILTPTTHTLTGDIEASVQWETTQNMLIEGDNLTVLKLLQKGYTKKVKMVYIDPPYNTGKDFIYSDNFHADRAEYEEATGQRSTDGVKMVANTETNGRYHSDWLSMMYPRLHLARNLLTDDGVIFVSIDDHEVHNLRKIMDEVFGEENFVGVFIWKKKGTSTNVAGTQLSSLTEYVVVYGKGEESLLNSRIVLKETRSYPCSDKIGNFRKTIIEKKSSGDYDRATMKFPILGKYPREGKRWQIGQEKAQELEKKERFIVEEDVVKLKIYDFEDTDTESAQPNLLLEHGSTQSGQKELDSIMGGTIFDTPKPTQLLRHFINLTTVGNEMIFDFFAGSGTTGHAVMSLNAEEKAEAVKNGTNPDEVGNRQYICVQIPELTDEKSEAFKAGYKKISDITAERLRRAGKKIAEENKTLAMDIGFRLYRLADSCYKVASVNYDSDNEALTLESFEKALASGLSPLRDGVTEADIVTENLLKEGFPLNTTLSQVTIEKTAFLYAENEGKRLFISFTDNIPLETIDAVQNDYKTAIFVVYDSALTDPLKVMLASRVTLRTI